MNIPPASTRCHHANIISFPFAYCVSHSGSSSGSSGGSIPHSFSVDEIQKMRVKLKSSKSYPNELLLNQQLDATKKSDDHGKQPSSKLTKDTLSANHDECDNSSSGVSSDQEVTASNVKNIANKITNNNNNNTSSSKIISSSGNNSTNAVENKQHGILKTSSTSTTTPSSLAHKTTTMHSTAKSTGNSNSTTLKTSATVTATAIAKPASNTTPIVKIVESINKKSINIPPLSNVTKKISAAVSESAQNANDDFDDFDDLPAKGFQRQVSLTRKQAASIAMNRAMYTKSAVSLAQLPPPIEGDSDDPDHQQSHCQAECRKTNLKVRKPFCFECGARH